MVHVPGNRYRQHQLAVLVSQGGVEVSTDARAANRLAEAFVEHRGEVHVETLIDQVHGAGRGHGADVERGLQVVGLRHAVADIEGAGHLRDGGVALRTDAAEFADLRQLAREVQLHELAVGQVERHISIQDRKSTRLNSSHVEISYAVFCLKKKKK